MEFVKVKILQDVGKWKAGDVKFSDEAHAKNLIREGLAEKFVDKPKIKKVKKDG